MKKYVIGIDYGTLSARAILTELDTGNITASSEFVYPHAVMTYRDFGVSTNKDTALQHPNDYIEAVSYTFHDVIKKSGVNESDILGVGIDFTASTILPVLNDGTPMCMLDRYKSDPHAYVKLWKHHGANVEAEEMTAAAKNCGEEWLSDFGGKVSSEWMFPKILEIMRCSPELFKDTERFMEAGEWIVMKLTGEDIHSSCMAGYKAQWSNKTGYPSKRFFAEFGSEFSDIMGTKVSKNVLPTGTKAGEINIDGSLLSGLCKGTAVAVPIIDAHASLPGTGVVDKGKLMIIIGTSCCHIILSDKDCNVEGICGKVYDGVIPGYYAYESGQCCVGDMFDCFVKNYVPERYTQEASDNNVNIFDLMTAKASALNIGENKLIALDWWNGNRSPYADYDLSGMIVGITLSTRPEHIFRALLESCAFGTKAIVDCFENGGIEVTEICASGGIAVKNPLLMQIFADVLGKKVRVSTESQACAKGSSVLAAYACGYYTSIGEAAENMCNADDIVYSPDNEAHEKYLKLYDEYRILSEYFANSGNDVMKRLKKL